MKKFIFDIQRFAQFTQIINSNGNTAVSGTGGDDLIISADTNVTIYGLAGNDSIDSGNGNTLNSNTSESPYGLIYGGDGKDSINHTGADSTIYGGNGPDYVSHRGNNSALFGEDGDDELVCVGDNSTIISGEGNHKIYTGGEHVTVIANTGNDSISNTGNNVTVFASGGNDTIFNSGDNVTLNASDGNDTISNAGPNVTILAGNGDDSILNSGSNVTISAGDGSNYIENYADNVTISAGSGEDSIKNGSSNVTISTGAGNDSISNLGDNVTIFGGTGDDNILGGYTGGIIYLYNAGDGNDSVSNIGDNNTLMIGGGSYTTAQSGNDLVVSVGNGSITFKDAAYMTLNIQGTAGTVTDTTPAQDSTLTQNTFVYRSGNDTINNFNSGDVLKFNGTYRNWLTDGDDLVINAAEGSVRIKDAQNKLIEVADANGNLLSHVYMSDDYEGAIDGRGFNKFEVIMGSDHADNQIWADAAGSSMWGGRGGSNDNLYGNLGIDEYIYAYGNGNDNIDQSGNEDTVNLLNMSLDQIAGAMIFENGTYFQFTDGGSLNINGQVGTFKVGGQTYSADYQNSEFKIKS